MATNPRPTGMTEEIAKQILQELYREISITPVSIQIQVGDREAKSMQMALMTSAEPAQIEERIERAIIAEFDPTHPGRPAKA